MPVRFKPHLLVISLAAAAALIASACGSDEGGGADGECSPGATRTCVGPAACQGGQACTADGSWSTCDCGGSGGAGGGGGAGGSSTGGAAGGDGSAGTGGSVGDASADGAGGGTQWKDDPCPGVTPIVNCSNTCGGPSASCETATCGFYEYSPWGPKVVRTPSKPGANSKCAAICGGSSLAFGIGLRTSQLVNDPTKGLVVKVPKPWSVKRSAYKYFQPTDFCGASAPPSQCVEAQHTNPDLLIVTTDPNAPAVNITLEEVPWPGIYCP